MDIISKERRSWNMSRIRNIDTTPEKAVRSALHKLGFRFRLHQKDLPGNPDIVLKKYRAVIFVNGCFWHRHPGCKFAYSPKSREEFWQRKFNSNIDRAKTVQERLENLGWQSVVIWECETENPEKLHNLLSDLFK
jgi:DNA mismatch endonuclease (patch repair protein)